MTKYIEKCSVKIMMEAFISEAKDKQDRIEELEADVRRLEKLLKNMGEDYMRLAHTQLDVDDYDLSKPFTYEPWPEGGFKRRPGLVPDKPLSCEEQMKETDALRVEVMSKIKRDKKASDFFDNLYKERKVKTDPWITLLKGVKKKGCLNKDLLKNVKDGLNLDENHKFYCCIQSRDPSVKFIVRDGDAYLATMSSSIKDMDALKEFYNSFKELFG